MVVVGRVGQPSAVLLSRNIDLHFKVCSQSVELDGKLCSPGISPTEGGGRPRKGPEKVDGTKTSLGKSFLLFWGRTSATLMLSLGKLMKMCGNSISCESLTNHSLIAPFFAVPECLFSFDEASGKNHFQIKLPRSCELSYLWTAIFMLRLASGDNDFITASDE